MSCVDWFSRGEIVLMSGEMLVGSFHGEFFVCVVISFLNLKSS